MALVSTCGLVLDQKRRSNRANSDDKALPPWVSMSRENDWSLEATRRSWRSEAASFVDEGMNTLLGLTPSAWEFPASAHFRSFANHVVYGATIGALVFLAQRISM